MEQTSGGPIGRLTPMADLEPIYLVVGNDAPKVATVVSRLRGRFDDDSVETYNASLHTAAEIVEAASMLGLFSTQRLIVVQAAESWKADDVSEILKYLEHPSIDTTVLLIADKLASNSRLLKAFAKPRLILCKGPEKRDEVVTWVGKQFSAQGKTVTAQMARRLVDIAGIDSLMRLNSDIATITTYAGDEDVTISMIEMLATPDAQEKVWILTDAWASRDRATLLRIAEQLLDQQEHPARLVSTLGRHIAMVHKAQRLIERDGAGVAQQALVSAGANPWGAKTAVRQAQSVSASQADAALTRIALLEAELKGASVLASGPTGPRVVFERGLAELV